jgi:hypothetical protein
MGDMAAPNHVETPMRRQLLDRLERDRLASFDSTPISDDGRRAILDWVTDGSYAAVVAEIIAEDPSLQA